MSEPQPKPRSEPFADWESFYANYRKPGYVPGFEITSKLGGGMFGLVFKATRQSIGKDYAIKFLKVDDGDVARAVLLELEQVKYFAQIDHPNLVSIEDKGEVDGIPFLVMAYAGAETLKDLLPADVGRRPEVLQLFLQACRGVAALHERSLVHFDLKPANVFLKGGVARVGDYGLSKLVTHSRGSLSMGRGTPYYMAPEMLQRRGDHRSDIYSLGVMLFEVLTGDVPFKGDSEWEVLRQHETAALRFPAVVGARERAIVERCMHKDPLQRYQSVHDLLQAFGAPVGVGAAAAADPTGAASGAGFGAGGRTSGAAKSAASTDTEPGASTESAAADEAYERVKEAAKRVFEVGSRVARSVAKNAGHVAKRAAADARAAARDAMDEHRRRRRRRRSAFARLFRIRRLRRKRERQERRLQRAGRRWTWHAAGMVFLLLPIALGMLVMLLAEPPSSAAKFAESAPVPPVPAAPRPLVPPRFAAIVSQGEPKWIAIAARDQAKARRLLQQQLEKFRVVAPLQPDATAVLVDLPQFVPKFDVDGDKVRSMQVAVDDLRRAGEWSQVLAARAQAYGRDALEYAAASLASPDILHGDPGEIRRLDRLLAEATGFDSMPSLAEVPAAEAVARAQHQGVMWLWFLHEFGPSAEAWRTYGQLTGR